MWNCFVAQKYLLTELRRHLSQATSVPLSQQLQNQLDGVDRTTRNYSSSLATEFPPPRQNSAAEPAHVASGHVSVDFLIINSPDAGTASNGGNHDVPVANPGGSEENTVPAGIASPDSSAGIASPDSPRSSTGSSDSLSQYTHEVENRTPNRLSDIDEDEEFDEDLTGYNDASSIYDIDEDYHDEYDDSEGSQHSAVPQETYTDSDSESHDSSALHRSTEHAGSESNVQRCAPDHAQQMQSLNNDREDEGTGGHDAWQQTHEAGPSHGLRDGTEQEGEQPGCAVAGHETARLSEERERLDSQRPAEVGLSDNAAPTDTVHTAPVHADSSHSLSSVDSADDLSEDEDNGTPSCELSDDLLSDRASHFGPWSPGHSTNTSASFPASPSLHDDDDDVFLPPFHQSDAPDDSGMEHRSSDDEGRASSPRQNVHSRSDAGADQPASPVSSSGSSYVRANDAYSPTSSPYSPTWWYRSHDSHTSGDSDNNSDRECWSVGDSRGPKRPHSSSSASDNDDDTDRPDSGGDRRHHKQQRFH